MGRDLPVNPHFQVPFAWDADGHAKVVEQDSTEEVQQCVEAIVRTPVGHRLELPTAGMPDMVFDQGGPLIGPVERAIANWEPRANVVLDLDHDDIADMLEWTLGIGVQGDD